MSMGSRMWLTTISRCTRRIMCIASGAPAAHTPLVMRSALLRPRIRGRCVRLSVSSAAGSYGKKRKVSITIRLRRHARSGAGERKSGSERASREDWAILHVEVATPHTGRSGGVSETHHRITVRGADLIDDIVSVDEHRTGSDLPNKINSSSRSRLLQLS